MNTRGLLNFSAGANVLVAVLCLYSSLSRDAQSQTAIATRKQGLETIAKHLKARTCWSDQSEKPFKLGDAVITEGSQNGRLPTECIFAPKPQQFLQVAYTNGELKVIQVYSRQEVRNQLSILKKEKNDGTR